MARLSAREQFRILSPLSFMLSTVMGPTVKSHRLDSFETLVSIYPRRPRESWSGIDESSKLKRV